MRHAQFCLSEEKRNVASCCGVRQGHAWHVGGEGGASDIANGDIHLRASLLS